MTGLLALPIMCAQQLPSAPSMPWTPPSSLHLKAPQEASPLAPAAGDQPLSLAALIDIAERRNPETRAAWERAREAAAAKGIARSALLPTLTGLVLGGTTRTGVLFDSSFVRQTEGTIEPALQLEYTVFDWNARVDALRAARYELYGSDFAFNRVHLDVIDAVAMRYFRLLNSQGEVAAAQANLGNADTVAAEVNARFAQGLATLPDALEARAAAAQALYELTNLQGVQSNAAADLATVLRLPASTVLPVVPLGQLAPPEALSETAADAIAHALQDRPDLLEQEARIAAAEERIRQARTAYLPQITFNGMLGRVRAFGEQDDLPSVYAATGVWNAQLNLTWTLFDGGRRASQIAEAIAEKATAQAQLDAARDQIEDQVWTAYTNTETAFAQQQAAELLLNSAQVSYDAATEAYGDGVRTLVDVVAAQRTLAQARADEVNARTNLFQQATDLTFRTAELLRSHPGPAVLPPARSAPALPSPTPPAIAEPPATPTPPSSPTPAPDGGE